MNSYLGKCSCGQTNVTINLPEILERYSPRKCDCDFCMARNICYLSHPDGTLDVVTAEPLEIQRQGSGQAEFMTCRSCTSVIAVSLRLENKLIGALNSAILLDSSLLQKPITVSPKVLSIEEKTKRWKTTWLEVKVDGGDNV